MPLNEHTKEITHKLTRTHTSAVQGKKRYSGESFLVENDEQ